MIVAQFGSKTVQMHKPVWLGGLVSQEVSQNPVAKIATAEVPWLDYDLDGHGAGRAPMSENDTTVQGFLHCDARHTIDEFERQVRRYTGTKDYLIGYRHATCQCGDCGPFVDRCQRCGRSRSVNWYAQKARLRDVRVPDAPQAGFRYGPGMLQVQMSFKAFSSWELMDTTRWAWGLPHDQAHFPEIDDTDFCNPRSVYDFHWPCDAPICTIEPPFRFYRRPTNWMLQYCIGRWSAGRWIRAAIGGQAFVNASGDTHPLSRLAFTNFSRLTVTVCSPTGFEYSFSVNRIVGEPQYLLIAPHMAPQIRYCPIHDDECLDAVPAAYIDIASEGHAIAVDDATTPVIGKLWPGRNYIQFDGFRLPGHPFHYSYDIVPQYI